MTDTQPLPAAVLDQLIDTGNKALNDYYHERACACSTWPASCASTDKYFFGAWDTDAFAIALPAIIAAYERTQPTPDKAECTVCGRTYRTRADGHVHAHSEPRSVHRCNGSPPEEVWLETHPATGTCSVCDREFHLTKTGKVWTHNNAIRDTASGSYGMRCGGTGQAPKES